MSTVSAPHHLNSTGCRIQYTQGKGRGVFACREIPNHTVIEISPVLFFSKDEYEEHVKYTVLDHYTFKWKDGRMALALGLGSLFNHSNTPNVSYTLDTLTESIRYEAVRDIAPDEELCIFYGHNLWFDPVDSAVSSAVESDVEDGWGGLSMVNEDEVDNNLDEVVEEDSLPFTRIKPPPEEEELETVRTIPAWVVDIPDPRYITTLLKWLKTSGLDDPDLGHLKRVRKQNNTTTLLLSVSPTPPTLPEDLNLPDPVQLPVPTSAALTLTSLSLKCTFWPTFYAPRKKGESEAWTRGQVAWARGAIKRAVAEGLIAKGKGELPIAACVPAPYGSKSGFLAVAHDTRRSTGHPLRHAVLALVRKMGDQHTSGDEPSGNGMNYLLTSQTVFMTHEPCIMCSMALLHSRVKQVFYLVPMSKTGGCGGQACLPTLPGVNHRFEICSWREKVDVDGVLIEEHIDA